MLRRVPAERAFSSPAILRPPVVRRENEKGGSERSFCSPLPLVCYGSLPIAAGPKPSFAHPLFACPRVSTSSPRREFSRPRTKHLSPTLRLRRDDSARTLYPGYSSSRRNAASRPPSPAESPPRLANGAPVGDARRSSTTYNDVAFVVPAAPAHVACISRRGQFPLSPLPRVAIGQIPLYRFYATAIF